MKQKESLKAFAIRLWEITQKMIQSKAIVLQYSFHFAMDAIGCKNHFFGANLTRRVQLRAFVMSSATIQLCYYNH